MATNKPQTNPKPETRPISVGPPSENREQLEGTERHDEQPIMERLPGMLKGIHKVYWSATDKLAVLEDQ
jgi:hypothetical protein